MSAWMAVLFLIVAGPASAGYILGNSYWLVTDASTADAFLSCPVKRVTTSQYCSSYHPDTVTYGAWALGHQLGGGTIHFNTYGMSSQGAADAKAASDCAAYEASMAHHGPGPGVTGTWCFGTGRFEPQVTPGSCRSYGTQYHVGSCMSESQARNAGLGSYIDQQLATYNKIPIAQNVTLTTVQESPGSTTVAATDSDGYVTGYAIHGTSPYGTAVLEGTTLTFTPNPGWSGNTSVTYRAQDDKGAWSSPATVSITVIPNIIPVAANVVLTTKEDVPGTVTVSATDEDDPVPTVFEVHGQSPHGTATISGNELTFTPNPDWYGTTTLTYRAQDARGGWSNPAVVTVVVTERKVVLSEFVYNSIQRSGTVKAVGIDEVPQAGKVVLLNPDGSTAYEVPAQRNEIDAASASYAYDLRNAPSGTYLLQAQVQDKLGATETLDYGEITIFVVKTLNFTYDPVTRLGEVFVEDKGEILKSVAINLLNDDGTVAYTVSPTCTPDGSLNHNCAFDLNGAGQGEYQAQVILTDNFDFQFDSDHGDILIDKTPAVITSTIPTDGKVGTIDEIVFNVKDTYDENVTIKAITLTGGADDTEQNLTWTRSEYDVKPSHFAMFPSAEGDLPYSITIETVDHQLNESQRTYTFTYNPELMELVTDLSKLGMDGKLGIPAIPYEFVRQGGGSTIETKEVKRRNGQLLTGQHDVYVTMRRDAFGPMRFNGHLVEPGQTVRIIEAQNFDLYPGLSIPIQAEQADLVGSTTFLLSIAAPETPVLSVPMYTWKGDVVLQSSRWEFRQVVDPLNIMAMPDVGVPCRVTVDDAAAKKADPISDPVCLVEWTETPDEAEMSNATVGGMRVAGLVGQAVRMGEQHIRYDLFLYSGDGTKVKIGSGERAINVVTARDSILFDHDLPNKQAFRLIDDLAIKFKQTTGPTCSLTLDAQQAITTGARSFNGPEIQRDCLFEWQQIPSGLQQNPRATVPVAVGYISELGTYTMGWRLSIYSRSGTRITLAEQTSDFSIVDPPAPTVDLVSPFVHSPDVLIAPIDTRELGDATITSENAAVRMSVTRGGNVVDSEVYPRRPDGRPKVMRRVAMDRTNQLWEPKEYTIRGEYERMPELFAEKTYTVYAGPEAGVRPMLEVDSQTALDTEPLRVRVRMGDLYDIRSPYDPLTMGDWRVRILSQQGFETTTPLTDFSDMDNGHTEFVLDISDTGERSIRLVAEAELISPIEGYSRTEKSTRALNLALLYGGAIQSDITARSMSGPAPFNAVFKAVPENRDMQASTGKVIWETSTDDGATWEEFVPEERYKLQYVRTFETGKYLVRARMFNRYSGIESYTETVEVVAYDQPVLELNGPQILFAGSDATISADAFLESAERVDGRKVKVRTPISTDGLVIEWSYDQGKTYTDVGPEVTVTGTEAKRVSIWARVRTEMAPESDRYAYTITKKSIEFKPVRGPRVRVQGPRIVEVGKSYDFEAIVAMPYTGMSERIDGQFTMPDGSTVSGLKATYTPTDEDLLRGNVDIRYDAWIVGWQDKGATGSHATSARIWKYEWPEFAFDYRGDYPIAPTTATLNIRTRGFSGTLEEPTYSWDIPAGMRVTNASSPTRRDLEIFEPGEYVISVTVRDARNNESVVEYPLSIKEAEPYVVDMRYSASNSEMREPLDIVVRPLISGGHPRDRVIERSYFVNNEPVEASGLYGRASLTHGDHEVKLRYSTTMGITGEATALVSVAQNQLPICKLSSREGTSSVRVTAECEDPDGRIRGHEWTIDGRVTSSSAKAITINRRPGEAMPTVTVVGIDDSNGRSEPVTLSTQ